MVNFNSFKKINLSMIRFVSILTNNYFFYRMKPLKLSMNPYELKFMRVN